MLFVIKYIVSDYSLGISETEHFRLKHVSRTDGTPPRVLLTLEQAGGEMFYRGREKFYCLQTPRGDLQKVKSKTCW